MVLASAEEKFFFHMHNFDDQLIDELAPEDEEEDLPPPPPIFTESELEAAKKKAFDEGHAKGVQATEASREQSLANLMQRLSNDTQTLFIAEAEREKMYEQEVIALCQTLFKQTFPTLHENHGFDALISQLESILQAQHGQKRIEIRISSDYEQGVKGFMDKLHARNPELNFNVISDEALESGSFKLNWDNGGATYDSPALAEKILSNLDEMLARKAVTSHDSNSSEESNISSETASDHGSIAENNPIAEDENDG